jgi:hypothetical protein
MWFDFLVHMALFFALLFLASRGSLLVLALVDVAISAACWRLVLRPSLLREL